MLNFLLILATIALCVFIVTLMWAIAWIVISIIDKCDSINTKRIMRVQIKQSFKKDMRDVKGEWIEEV